MIFESNSPDETFAFAKKLGEEATEITIAAKNPDVNELHYEIADYLYHLMVLMSERGITWDEITETLARR